MSTTNDMMSPRFASRFARVGLRIANLATLSVLLLPACYDPDGSLPSKGPETVGHSDATDGAGSMSSGGDDCQTCSTGGDILSDATEAAPRETDDPSGGADDLSSETGSSTGYTEKDPTDAPELGVCGDGVLQDGEVCDDGNGNDFDGCDTGCRATLCGYKIDLLDSETCFTGLAEFCVPESRTWTEAACKACSGAPCTFEPALGGSVWTSMWGRSYVAETISCPLIGDADWFMPPGLIKEADHCVRVGDVVTVGVMTPLGTGN